jgi:prolyl 4-hydroxylase
VTDPGGDTTRTGDLEAVVARAEQLALEGNADSAVENLKQAADRGHAYASALLGAWQTLGHAIDADPTAGIARLEAAAHAGESAAGAFLANLYAGGLQVEQSWQRAIDWLMAAARLGNARALTELALMAQGPAPDPLRIHLLMAAATRDFAPAQYLLGRELAGSDDSQHRQVGAAWIGAAAAGGNPSARAEVAPDQPVARSRGAIPVEGYDWPRVRERCDPAALLARPLGTAAAPVPQATTFQQLIPESWCHYVMGLAAPRLQRATVNDIARGAVVHEMRTNSTTCFPAADSDPLLQLINHRVAQACGLPLAHQEVIAVLHYRPGQTYEDHFDFIDPEVPRFREELTIRGQRVVTVLIYLSAGYEGGETDFPLLGWRHKGRPGGALVFRNVNDAGDPDRRTLHAGRAPTSGEKWLLSKWVRSRPQAVHDRG